MNITKHTFGSVAFLIAASFLIQSAAPNVANAYKQFQDHWQDLYLEDHPDQEFAEMVRKKAKCYVCHQGRKKSHCNPYGKLFIGKLEKGDRKDDEKILAAIKEVGALRLTPEDESGPTCDEIIAESKLPGGTLEQAKQEPEEEE